ncbi:MAG: Dot/Icm type IV secretion system ATPase DotB [Pseudomonadota bacterium]
MNQETAVLENTEILPDEPTRFTPAHLDILLEFCEGLNASDITIQTNEPIFAECYGRLKKITTRKLSNTEVGDVLNKIYGPNGTAQILSGVDVDTHYEFRPSRSRRFRYRVNGTGCQVEGHDGIQLTLRSIPTTPPPLTSLNLEPDLFNAVAPRDGCVYVTGATGSGKSTLLASIIRDLVEKSDGNRKALTYEAPIEFVFDEVSKPSSVVSQTEIPRHLPSFAAGVRNALRRKPMLILVGESRDAETIAAVLEAALTGHPVYTTLHTNGVAETIRRLVTTFPAGERQGRTIDLIETMRLIIWQKLVPTVDGKRVALREYLVFNEDIRDELLTAPFEKITAVTRDLLKRHGQPMIVDAKKKYDAGLISDREFQILTTLSRREDKDALEIN